MRSFERNRIEPGKGGLVLSYGGTAYRLCFLHAALDYENAATDNRCAGRRQHVHDEAYHVLLYTKGGSCFAHMGHDQVARRGTLVLMPPGEPHSFSPAGTEATIYSEVTFAFLAEDGAPLQLSIHDLLAAYAGYALQPRGFPLQADRRQETELMGIFSKMMDGLEMGGMLGKLTAHQAMGGLLVCLLKEFYISATPVSRAPPGLALARAHIEAHYREALSIGELARTANLSAGYFQRAFSAAFGVTPMRYQAGLKIEAARTLLAFSDMPCKEMAARLGYSDVYHFSRAFNKAVGHPPAKFRAGKQKCTVKK